MVNIKATMSECMQTDKPLISILMAVYEPNMKWLREQLDSLEAQTYPNLMLYLQDDCSETVLHEDIQLLVRECIHSFPYRIGRNIENLGFNRTFEQMTKDAKGEYFAYCDQDDIWMPEKLMFLQQELERRNALLVCSDMYIIDSNGKQIADSITKIRRHHIFRSGSGLADTLWYSNFASGCALLVRAETAKSAVPLNPYMYYDHYIALYAANSGIVISLETPLLYHREHGGNQSSSMRGIIDRDSYCRLRVDRPVSAVHWLFTHFPASESLQRTLYMGQEWLEARQAYLHGERKKAHLVWKHRHFSPMASLFEIALPYLPEPLFKVFIWAVKNNYL